MSFSRRAVVLALSVGLITAAPAKADLIAFPGKLLSSTLFNQFIGFNFFSQPGFISTQGPLEVGLLETPYSVELTSSGFAAVGSGVYGFDNNGRWDEAQTPFVGLNAPLGALVFNFKGAPVSAVGGFMNYATVGGRPSSGNPTIYAVDANSAVLESYSLFNDAPIDNPGSVNQGGFRGIVRQQPDIAFFIIRDSSIAIDDLWFRVEASAAAPEPGTGIMIGLPALAAMPILIRRHRKRQSLT